MKSAGKIISKNGRGLGRTIEKYGAPIAATGLALTGAGLPASMAIMAGTKAAGSALAGHNLQDTLKAGATGAGQGALSFGAGKALSGLGSKASGLLGMSKSTAPVTSGLALPTGAKMAADGTLQAAKTMTTPMLGSGATQASRSGLLGILGKAAGAAKQNPLVVGQIASGVMGARAQSAQTALERKQMEDEERRRRNRSELFAPLATSTLRNSSGFITPYNPNYGR